MGRVSELIMKGNNKIAILAVGLGLLFFSAIFALIVAIWSTTGGLLLIIGIVVPIFVFCIIRYPHFGILTYLTAAYFVMYALGFQIDYPLGTVMDSILLLLIIGFFINQKTKPNWEIFKNPVTFMILVWISYNLIQVINPNAESRLAWLYTIRAVAGVMLSYFIFNYQINSVKFIRLIFKMWLVFSILGALYAIKQEYFGFFDYEQRVLDANPLLQNLLYINGHWRKSSIYSDPVSFAYNMAVSTILCIILITGPTRVSSKIKLAIMAALFMNVMLYSGTRAAYVLVPSAMILLLVVKFNTRILIFFGAFSLLLAMLVYTPTSNASLARFQSAFRPSDDASYNVRAQNQKRIQPYIQTHPLGGGLGATGVWGVRFSPNSFLAQFPPDSGFVRVAVELGWIGLGLICALFFVVLRTGINNYFAIKDPELKTYCLAMVLMVFAIAIGNFPQEGIVQFPLSVYFYLIIALMNITLRLDQEKNPEHHLKPEKSDGAFWMTKRRVA
ncbi:O-antigen ligase family protein [Pedobacter duraquae]|uniref:O-antigen ligase-like membrane protein n=1 Tax=Pedobacter duraquae TaxID=425511 RepID=A0A4R6IQ31_9SPHI|nr:O-antigen ligase family protein [Pedobacter duraquae]TDO24065.1 O-antigen ligase-like membrane protein [Pedobacter duraquae]